MFRVKLRRVVGAVRREEAGGLQLYGALSPADFRFEKSRTDLPAALIIVRPARIVVRLTITYHGRDSHRRHCHRPSPSPCPGRSRGSIRSRSWCVIVAVFHTHPTLTPPERPPKLVPLVPLRPLATARPQRRHTHLLPAEMDRQGQHTRLPRRAHPREEVEAPVQTQPARRRAHGAQVPRRV